MFCTAQISRSFSTCTLAKTQVRRGTPIAFSAKRPRPRTAKVFHGPADDGFEWERTASYVRFAEVEEGNSTCLFSESPVAAFSNS